MREIFAACEELVGERVSGVIVPCRKAGGGGEMGVVGMRKVRRMKIVRKASVESVRTIRRR